MPRPLLPPTPPRTRPFRHRQPIDSGRSSGGDGHASSTGHGVLRGESPPARTPQQHASARCKPCSSVCSHHQPQQHSSSQTGGGCSNQDSPPQLSSSLESFDFVEVLSPRSPQRSCASTTTLHFNTLSGLASTGRRSECTSLRLLSPDPHEHQSACPGSINAEPHSGHHSEEGLRVPAFDASTLTALPAYENCVVTTRGEGRVVSIAADDFEDSMGPGEALSTALAPAKKLFSTLSADGEDSTAPPALLCANVAPLISAGDRSGAQLREASRSRTPLIGDCRQPLAPPYLGAPSRGRLVTQSNPQNDYGHYHARRQLGSLRRTPLARDGSAGVPTVRLPQIQSASSSREQSAIRQESLQRRSRSMVSTVSPRPLSHPLPHHCCPCVWSVASHMTECPWQCAAACHRQCTGVSAHPVGLEERRLGTVVRTCAHCCCGGTAEHLSPTALNPTLHAKVEEYLKSKMGVHRVADVANGNLQDCTPLQHQKLQTYSKVTLAMSPSSATSSGATPFLIGWSMNTCGASPSSGGPDPTPAAPLRHHRPSVPCPLAAEADNFSRYVSHELAEDVFITVEESQLTASAADAPSEESVYIEVIEEDVSIDSVAREVPPAAPHRRTARPVPQPDPKPQWHRGSDCGARSSSIRYSCHRVEEPSQLPSMPSPSLVEVSPSTPSVCAGRGPSVACSRVTARRAPSLCAPSGGRQSLTALFDQVTSHGLDGLCDSGRSNPSSCGSARGLSAAATACAADWQPKAVGPRIRQRMARMPRIQQIASVLQPVLRNLLQLLMAHDENHCGKIPLWVCVEAINDLLASQHSWDGGPLAVNMDDVRHLLLQYDEAAAMSADMLHADPATGVQSKRDTLVEYAPLLSSIVDCCAVRERNGGTRVSGAAEPE